MESEYNEIRNKLEKLLNEKTELAKGIPFNELKFKETWSPISSGDLEKINHIDTKISACYLRMREIIRLQRS